MRVWGFKDLVAIELEGFVEGCSLVARAHGVPREVLHKLVHRAHHDARNTYTACV